MAEAKLFGGITVGEIEAFTQANEIPSEAGTPIETRFVRSVCDLISQRTNHETGDYSAFVLWRSSQFPELESILFPLLKNGNDPISGAIWLVNKELGRASRRLKEPCVDQVELFAMLEAAGLQDETAIVVDWRSSPPCVSLFARGIRDGEEMKSLYLEEAPISADLLKRTLDQIYEDHFRNPIVASKAHQQSIWSDAGKGWPADRPEERIHGRLFAPLKTTFPRHDVRSEVHTNDGRADVTIVRKVMSQHGHQSIRTDWLLELKALCDRSALGKPKHSPSRDDALKKGLVQILGYTKDTLPLQRALCCYDLRAKDEGDSSCFSAITTEALGANIYLWRWFLYRSSEDARSAAVSGQV